MNKDLYKGLFFGGIIAYFIAGLLTLIKLEDLSIVVYFVLIAIFIVINDFLNKKGVEK